jgi:DNA repair protein RecO (recombination protein O)
MLHKTRAISLHAIPFRDTSLIARFFTEEFGLQGFVVNGVRTSKARISPALFQAMMPVDLIQYHDNRKDLNRFSEIKAAFPLSEIPLHPVKSAQVIFVAEYLSRVLKDHLENRSLFAFTFAWISELDSTKENFESAHLGFLWHSFSHLGITPDSSDKLLEKGAPLHEEHRQKLNIFLEGESPFTPFRVPSQVRQTVLDALVDYVRSHMEGMGELKSLAVLRQVFS